jgi:hypothetical protein
MCEATYSLLVLASQSVSAREPARLSRTVPVSTQDWLAVFRRKMWYAAALRDHMLAHHKPSFHQSLLSGFSPVGLFWAPTVDGPSNPMSPVAA